MLDENNNIDNKVILLKTISVVSVLVGVAFFVIANDKYLIVNEITISLSVVLATFIVAVICLLKCFKSDFFRTYRAGNVFFWSFVNFTTIPFCLIGLGYLINGHFDHSESEVFELKVLDARKLYRNRPTPIIQERYYYKARLKDWRSELDVVELFINEDEYHELQKEKNNRYMTIITKPGYLGEEWFVSVNINPLGKKTITRENNIGNGGLILYEEN
jgi:hypothetical protein